MGPVEEFLMQGRCIEGSCSGYHSEGPDLEAKERMRQTEGE